MRVPSSIGALAAVVALTRAPAPASAQALEIAPTYQASVARMFTELPQSQWQAWGVMAGFQQTGAWSPHVWVQRYRLESD